MRSAGLPRRSSKDEDDDSGVMRLLFIGGTGLISSACARIAYDQGHDLTVLTRGRSQTYPAPRGARHIIVDAKKPTTLRSSLERNALGDRFDAVVQFIANEPGQVPEDVVTFAPRANQYIFISSAATYRPADRLVAISESSEQSNDTWDYARKKIQCEQELLMYAEAASLPYTIVRPGYTYGPSFIPGYIGNTDHPWTLVDRMRRGADIVLPGDGTSAWTLTHSRDVAAAIIGLIGNEKALGKAVNVASTEALTWDTIYRTIANAAGVDMQEYESQIVHVPSDALVASYPSAEGEILGDKMHNKVIDSRFLRSLIPGYKAKIRFADGIKESIAWFEANPARQTVDAYANAHLDRVAAIYRGALDDASQLPTP
ncbi:MAG: NAD-dependent epimerase/dehydratase family protein [Demequinaceae bacterium]|nr:NAD-dependent epimerase/dehydratase family protein [Demequinaceae bacterium]